MSRRNSRLGASRPRRVQSFECFQAITLLFDRLRLVLQTVSRALLSLTSSRRSARHFKTKPLKKSLTPTYKYVILGPSTNKYVDAIRRCSDSVLKLIGAAPSFQLSNLLTPISGRHKGACETSARRPRASPTAGPPRKL